uniref:Uncharacterized protein n=1 Tax=Chromera velia CCMP2878 TaxID=1169474 RepID=A0A0G4F2N4_9ALVE|eukprot:Cvel_14916.t1-p1 / transcript=Cvel_14916.t1 / gene=Cvel_14916 / organism=Chromera_velia_CCMP2878 / gene_product=hypothetical protein / transcript_product=hypothetical protein / location=Cvel_scaffold1081:4748-6143(-) / protein_length=394 / sequence_SO=supercontig / SO=protein_coding / is_pseudo=false
MDMAHLTSLAQLGKLKESLLREADLGKGSDRQNVRTARQVTHPEVINILWETDAAEGTTLLLNLANLVDTAFCAQNLSLEERIEKMSTAVWVSRLWKAWVDKCSSETLSKVFLTRNVELCIEVNFHSLIALIRFLREKHPDVEFKTWLGGSQAKPCEELFRLLRLYYPGHTQVVNFGYLTLLRCLQNVVRDMKLRFENEKENLIEYSSTKSRKTRGDLPKAWESEETCRLISDEKIAAAVEKGRERAWELIGKVDSKIYTDFRDKVKWGGQRTGRRKSLTKQTLLDFKWESMVKVSHYASQELIDDDETETVNTEGGDKIADDAAQATADELLKQESDMLRAETDLLSSIPCEGNGQGKGKDGRLRVTQPVSGNEMLLLSACAYLQDEKLSSQR